MLDLDLSLNSWIDTGKKDKERERMMESQTWTLSGFSILCFPVQSSVALSSIQARLLK